jgi:hypothetical protein
MCKNFNGIGPCEEIAKHHVFRPFASTFDHFDSKPNVYDPLAKSA